MAKKSQEKQRGWLNKSDMASSLGISVQAFDKWGVEPAARIGREVFYDTRAVLDNRLDHQQGKKQLDDELDPLAEQKLTQERLRLTKAQAEAQELKNEVTRRTLIPADFAVFALGQIVPEVSSLMDTLPMTMRRKHPDLAARHITTLEREATKVRNTCASFADKLPELADEFFSSTD